jgi:hypothetical protein
LGVNYKKIRAEKEQFFLKAQREGLQKVFWVKKTTKNLKDLAYGFPYIFQHINI